MRKVSEKPVAVPVAFQPFAWRMTNIIVALCASLAMLLMAFTDGLKT